MDERKDRECPACRFSTEEWPKQNGQRQVCPNCGLMFSIGGVMEVVYGPVPDQFEE